MLGSVGVLAICGAAWILYERGDGWDSLFLILFSLSQLIEDSSTKLFWKCFLPALSLCQYLFKHYSQPSSRAHALVHKTSKIDIVNREPVSPDSVRIGGSPREDRKSARTFNENINSNAKHGKAVIRGSSLLARRLLTLTCHLNVLRNVIHNSPSGLQIVNDEVELVVYAAILTFVFSLPVFPGIGIAIISLLVYIINFTYGHWEEIIRLLDTFITTFISICTVVQPLKECHVPEVFRNAWISGHEIYATIGRSLQASDFASILWTNSRAIIETVCSVILENEECIYAVVFLTEPLFIGYMKQLCAMLGIGVPRSHTSMLR